MAGQVIQGFFLGGRMPHGTAARLELASPGSGAPGRTGPLQRAALPPIRTNGAPGRPPLAHQAARPGAHLQCNAFSGRLPSIARPNTPAPVRPETQAIQRFGGAESFAIDPNRVGLVNRGGAALPTSLLAKMEAAFGADFSGVRVHVGPQAARIGAIAFTTGNDLYFAPGQYQPNTTRGQQLIGHELAHVIQQRQGRVRAPTGGVAVVQDAALEAEADRQGMRAAAHVPVAAVRSGQPGGAVQRFGAPTLQLSKSNKRKAKTPKKRKKKEDPDGDFVLYKKQRRGNFTASNVEDVIRRTAHVKQAHHIDGTKFRNVWTCPACKRPLAFETVGGAFKLIPYKYTSKKGNPKSQRAVEIDHHPEPWARIEPTLDPTMDAGDFRDIYTDPTNTRALCRACNGSHEYEGYDVEDYDSSDDDEPPSTPKHEQPDNSGHWTPYVTVP